MGKVYISATPPYVHAAWVPMVFIFLFIFIISSRVFHNKCILKVMDGNVLHLHPEKKHSKK